LKPASEFAQRTKEAGNRFMQHTERLKAAARELFALAIESEGVTEVMKRADSDVPGQDLFDNDRR
jgi:succinyl-CoA synthetase beta subunit